MKRILFVDDEQHVLAGLENMLRRQRKVWHMDFASSGQAALDLMDGGAYDVVVTDMRMPSMDGAALLHQVKRRHPETARIVLSGHADRASVLQALAVSHQYLAKPCDADTLRTVIERACQLQSLLVDHGIRGLVGRLDKLPALAESYWQLMRAIDDPAAGIPEVAAIVERDLALSAKVLQLVNSAYFGFGKPVTSVARAVGHLGIELIKSLALTSQVFAAAEGVSVPGFSLEDLQLRSLLVAQVARAIVARPECAEEAFAAGIVHDIGHLLMALGQPSLLGELLAESRASGRPMHVIERERIGYSHAEVGAFLFAMWGLPLSLVNAVAQHHSPDRVVGDPTVVLAVHAADALVDALLDRPNAESPQVQGGAPAAALTARPSSLDKIDLAALDSAGMAGRVPAWRATAAAIVGKVGNPRRPGTVDAAGSRRT